MTMTLPIPDFSRLAPPAGYRLAITGGCGGIGRRLTEVAAAEGLRIAVIDLPGSLERHALPAGVETLPYDARDDESAAQAFAGLAEAWGGALDGLVHLPGYMSPPKPVEDMTAAEIDEALSVNLRSAFLAVKAALPMLRKGAGETGNASGMVIAASGLATLVEKTTGTYSAAKAGIIALAKGLAKENAPEVRANCIAPGAVDTAFLRGGTGRGGDVTPKNEQDFPAGMDNSAMLATIPLGRIAVTDDIVGPVLFLLSEKARFMTGQTLYINGGRLMV
ncbi:MAG: SDR family oxidoreductase [Rhodospirillaceae bacterium]|nr:SDR family oxidoreductase [Rhodospirillaceae bacterium]